VFGGFHDIPVTSNELLLVFYRKLFRVIVVGEFRVLLSQVSIDVILGSCSGKS
jgi:hypothetical protein